MDYFFELRKMKFYQHYKTNEDFVNFVTKTIQSKISKKPLSSKKLHLNPKFDNVLLHDNHEILIIPKENIDDIVTYEFSVIKLPKNIHIRFGCELEICFDIKCTDSKKPTLNNENWKDRILYYIKTHISPFLNKKFLKRFPYAYIMNYYRNDLNHKSRGYLINLEDGSVIGKNFNDNDSYKTLIFTQDGSIRCKDRDKRMIACEIITPVLSDIKDLSLLYKGLRVEDCTHTNKTMGFHVNISAVDEKNEPVEISRCMLVSIIYNWIEFEQKYYYKLRGKGIKYAESITSTFDSNYAKEMIDLMVENIDGNKILNNDYFKPYGLNVWMAEKFVNTKKYLSLTHWKQNNVIEYRIFPSVNKVETLLHYTQQAVKNFKSSINNYIKHPDKIIDKLQSYYLQYRYKNITTTPFTSLAFYYKNETMLGLIFDASIEIIYKYTSFYFWNNYQDYSVYDAPENENMNVIIDFGQEVVFKYDFVKKDDGMIYLTNGHEISYGEFYDIVELVYP